jgi:hypothetical protein
MALEFVWVRPLRVLSRLAKLQASTKLQVGSQLVVGLVEVAFDSRVLDSVVHSFDLPIIRYEIIGASLSGRFRKGTGDMVSPSGTRGAGSTEVRAGRR